VNGYEVKKSKDTHPNQMYENSYKSISK